MNNELYNSDIGAIRNLLLLRRQEADDDELSPLLVRGLELCKQLDLNLRT